MSKDYPEMPIRTFSRTLSLDLDFLFFCNCISDLLFFSDNYFNVLLRCIETVDSKFGKIKSVVSALVGRI